MAIPERWRPLLVAGFLFGAIAWLAYSLYDLAGSTAWGYDYAAYHAAAERLVETGSPYQAHTLAGPFRPGPFGLYLYSPVPAALLVPLTSHSPAGATWLWLALHIVVLGLSCALMPVPVRTRLLVFAVACLSWPVLRDLVLGNVSLLVTFLAVVGWRFLDRPAGAAAIAVSLALRPTMGLLLGWWLIRGRWRPLLWAIGVALLLVLFSLPVVGLRGWLEYMTVLRNLTDFEAVVRNLAFGELFELLGAPAPVVLAATLASYGLAAAAVVLSLRRDRELSYVVTLGATLLLSPLLWDHYLTNLLVPAAFLAGRGRWLGLALPLVCWLPPESAFSLIAMAGLLLPFLAADRGQPAGSILDLLSRRRPTPARA